MAWLKLMKHDGNTILVNTDQASEFTAYSNGVTVWLPAFSTDVRESVDEIATMIDKAEWRERVLRVACAILSNNRGDGLTSDQVWARAVRFAMVEPEQPTTP